MIYPFKPILRFIKKSSIILLGQEKKYLDFLVTAYYFYDMKVLSTKI